MTASADRSAGVAGRRVGHRGRSRHARRAREARRARGASASSPGADVVQTGARGGITSVFVRGGASNFNKVLIDGVPANDIGGAFDFSDVATTGVDRVEMLRDANSVLVRQRRADRRDQSHDATGTHAHSRAVAGARRRRVRYVPAGRRRLAAWSSASTTSPTSRTSPRTTTCRTTPTATTRSPAASAGRSGSGANLSATVRHMNSGYGSPNAVDFFGIADDSSQTSDATYVSVTSQSQIGDRWQTTLRFASMDQAYHVGEPVADRPAVRSVRLRIPQLPRQRRHASRRERLLGHRPGDSRLSAGRIRSRTTRAPRAAPGTVKRACTSRTRWISPPARTSSTKTDPPMFARLAFRDRAHQRGSVCRGPRHAASRVRQRRRRLRPQRDLQVGGDAARVGRRLPSRSIVDRGARRHEADAQRGHRHQGAEHFAGAVVALCAGAGRRGACAVGGPLAHRTGAQPQRRRRHRPGLLGRPRAGARVVLRQSVFGSDRVREQERVAAARHSGAGGGGHRIRRVRQFVRRTGRAASRCRRKRSWAPMLRVRRLVHVPARRRHEVVREQRACAGHQSGVSRCADRRVRPAHRRARRSGVRRTSAACWSRSPRVRPSCRSQAISPGSRTTARFSATASSATACCCRTTISTRRIRRSI